MFKNLRPKERSTAWKWRDYCNRIAAPERCESRVLKPWQENGFPSRWKRRADIQRDGVFCSFGFSAGHLIDTSRFYERATVGAPGSRSFRKSPTR